MRAMGNGTLTSDPYNLIIAGVGGQGNVLASRVVGAMLTGKGYHVTIGDTFGASQRGGSLFGFHTGSRKWARLERITRAR